MYIPIAALYANNGTIRGLRFFQWQQSGTEPRDIQQDTRHRGGMKIGKLRVSFKRVIDVPIRKLHSIKNKLDLFSGSEIVLAGFSTITCIRDDGEVWNNSVAILSVWSDLKKDYLTIVDREGEMRYIRRDEWEILQRKGIRIAYQGNIDLSFALTGGLKYAAPDYVRRCELLQMQLNMSGFGLSYTEETGDLVLSITNQKSVLVPEGVTRVVSENTTGLEQIALPRECSIACPSRSLRQLKCSQRAQLFRLITGTALKQIDFPKSMGSLDYLGSFWCKFEGGLPDAVTTIDQSNYFLEENTLVVSGRNRLMYAKLALSSLLSTEFMLSPATSLERVDVVDTVPCALKKLSMKLGNMNNKAKERVVDIVLHSKLEGYVQIERANFTLVNIVAVDRIEKVLRLTGNTNNRYTFAYTGSKMTVSFGAVHSGGKLGLVETVAANSRDEMWQYFHEFWSLGEKISNTIRVLLIRKEFEEEVF